MDRRQFIKNSAAIGAATWAAGSILGGCSSPSIVQAPKYQGRRLILISLDGGHDGLHAIAPKDVDLMHKLRPKVYADTLNKGIPLTTLGEHSMVLHRDLKNWLPGLRNGEIRVIPNAGLPMNEWNGSHFVSQDFWSMAEYEGNRNAEGSKGTGWIGRLLSNKALHINEFKRTAIGIQDLITLILQGDVVSGVAWPGLEKADPKKQEIVDWLTETPLIQNDGVYQEMADMSQIYQWLSQSTPSDGFQNSGLGLQLAHAATIIKQDLPFKIIKCSMGGFDTHSGQLARHIGAYESLSNSLGNFHKFLAENHLLEQTMVVVYSEFGRTIYENSALGTEHGTAGPMYVIGGGECLREFTDQAFTFGTVKLPGTDQTEYLKHQIDFRDVFQVIQRDWLLA